MRDGRGIGDIRISAMTKFPATSISIFERTDILGRLRLGDDPADRLGLQSHRRFVRLIHVNIRMRSCRAADGIGD